MFCQTLFRQVYIRFLAFFAFFSSRVCSLHVCPETEVAFCSFRYWNAIIPLQQVHPGVMLGHRFLFFETSYLPLKHFFFTFIKLMVSLVSLSRCSVYNSHWGLHEQEAEVLCDRFCHNWPLLCALVRSSFSLAFEMSLKTKMSLKTICSDLDCVQYRCMDHTINPMVQL